METIVKERPILFSGPMVRALLDGSKTQTRRKDKEPPMWNANGYWQYAGKQWPDTVPFSIRQFSGPEVDKLCPYGQPGERLWVRENFQAFVPGTWAMVITLDQNCVTAFQATEPERAAQHSDRPWAGPWRPSIHMPRRLSRILLEIVSVRCERLNNISPLDAIAEGIEVVDHELDGSPYYREYLHPKGGELSNCTHQPRLSYRSLWRLINGLESWDLNPWVWVVEFKVIEPTPTTENQTPAL